MDARVGRARQLYQMITSSMINGRSECTTILPLPPGGENGSNGNAYQIAGSILVVYNEGALTEFFAHRASQTVTINVQMGCPVAYALGYMTMTDQRDLWRKIEHDCRNVAKNYEVRVVFNCTADGEVIDLLS